MVLLQWWVWAKVKHSQLNAAGRGSKRAFLTPTTRCSHWFSQQRQTREPGLDTPTTGSTLFLFFLSPGNFLSSNGADCFVTTNYQTPLLKSKLDLQETLSKQAPEVATSRNGPDLSQHIRDKRHKANFICLTFLLTSSSSSALMHDGSFSKGLTKGDDCLASGLKFGDKVIFATDGPPWELMESSERWGLPVREPAKKNDKREIN